MNEPIPDIDRDSAPIGPQRWLLSGQITLEDPVRQYEIHESRFTIGRSSSSSLCLPIGNVSKHHAEIRWDGQQLKLRDRHSTNGTFVNGQRINSPVHIKHGDLLQFASVVFRVGRQGALTDHQTVHEDNCDQALAMIQFDRLIDSNAFVPYFQPIVSLDNRDTVGFEVLGRSRLFGLQSPVEMFSAASQLNLEVQLSETFRQRGVEVGSRLGTDVNLFVNTHPKELGTQRFYQSLRRLRQDCDQTITLEIHERTVTDSDSMRTLCAVLKDLDIRLAFDDFGVGEARLVELGEYRPDYLKFDMELTRSIDAAPMSRLEVVGLLAKLVIDLGIEPLAEGVENEVSHQILADMGFRLGQGFYYGRPETVARYLGEGHLSSGEAGFGP